MIPRKVFTRFAKFQGIVSVNDFWLPIGLPELLQTLVCNLRSFVFCTDKIESVELPNLGPLQRFDDCVEMHILHLELCDLLLFKSKKKSARGMAAPVRFLQGALVILVLMQMSQFRSFGK